MCGKNDYVDDYFCKNCGYPTTDIDYCEDCGECECMCDCE